MGKFFTAICITAGLFCVCGCRMAGDSGFTELTYNEKVELASYAAGVLQKTKVVKNNRRVPTPEARDYISEVPPIVRIDYSGNCSGRASFTWQYDAWQYKIYCQGKLNGNFNDLDWCVAIAPPVTAEEGTAEIWKGPSPDMLELQMLHERGVQLLPTPEGKLEYVFEDEQLKDEITVEGAVIKGTGGM